MKLFTVGPVESYQESREIYRHDIPYFRTEKYGSMVKDSLLKIASLLGCTTKEGVIYLTASGTAAMEATVENCLNAQDKVLVINGGAFGHRFCELLEWHKIPFTPINLQWDETLTKQHLKRYENQGYTALLVNLHETSTGQLYDVQMLSDFCQRNHMFFIVDAISTFLADDYNMDKYHIDVTIFSSQKGLCLSPGLSFVAFSQKMKDKVRASSPKTYYFNFAAYFTNLERGQTPFTPAVSIMYEAAAVLSLIDKIGGKEKWLQVIKEKAMYFREQARKFGLTIPTYPLSNMLTPIYFEDINAYDVFLALSQHYDIYVNPCGGDLASKMLRISHVGNTTRADIDDLIEKLVLCVKEVRSQR